MEPQPHKTHFTHTHHTTHTQTQTHKMFAKMISSIVSFWVPFAGPVLTLLGWKLCFLLVGVCMATYGLKQVDAEQLSWLGGRTKVFETQQQRVTVPSTGMFGLMGALGFTQSKLVSQKVVKRQMRSPGVGSAGLVLLFAAISGFLAGDVVAAGTTAAAVGTLCFTRKSPSHLLR